MSEQICVFGVAASLSAELNPVVLQRRRRVGGGERRRGGRHWMFTSGWCVTICHPFLLIRSTFNLIKRKTPIMSRNVTCVGNHKSPIYLNLTYFKTCSSELTQGTSQLTRCWISHYGNTALRQKESGWRRKKYCVCVCECVQARPSTHELLVFQGGPSGHRVGESGFPGLDHGLERRRRRTAMKNREKESKRKT